MANHKQKTGQMKRLQRKLVPMNIIVSIISIVAAVTLFFSPLLEIKLGAITSHPDVIEFVDDIITKALDDETSSVEGETGDLLADIDVPKIVVPIVESVFTMVDGNVSISTNTLLGLAKSADPGTAVADMFLSEKDGLLTQLVESLVKAVMDLPKNKQVQGAIEEIILVSMSTQVKANVPDQFKNLVDPQELAKTLSQMNGAKTEADAVKVIDEYLDKVEAAGEGEMDDTKRQEIKDMMSKVYNDTVEYTKDDEGNDNFSVEAMVCVAASGTLSSEELDDIRNEDGSVDLAMLIEKMMGGMGGGSGAGAEASALSAAVTFEGETEVPDGEGSGEGSEEGTGEGETEGGTTEGGSTEGGNESEGGNEGGSEEGGDTVDYEVYTTYEDLFGRGVKIDEDEVRAQIKKLVDENVGAIVEQTVNMINDMNANFPLFWIVFGVFAAFAGVWAILALFAFLHLFSKNKRFTMWYVKLLGAIPALLFWIAPMVAGWAIPVYFPTLLGEFSWALPVLLSALGTMTWISGVCYIVLWVLSIFWGFPVKHKIRNLIKQRRG